MIDDPGALCPPGEHTLITTTRGTVLCEDCGWVEREATENYDIVKGVVGWMLDETDDIEGTCLRLSNEPGPWVHTTAQVQDWLRERLPAAIRHYMSIPSGGESGD